jgi:hypothetical protein
MPGTCTLISALLVALVGVATAQPASTTAQPVSNAPQPTSNAPGPAAEFLVPPQGGAFEVAVHAGEVCILSFPDKVSSKALASSPDFEIKAWGDDGVAVRAYGANAKTTTLAVATASGAVKINVTLTVVAADKPSSTLVRFKAVTMEQAFEARVKAEVEQRLVPLAAEVTKVRQDLDHQIRDLDRQVRDRADGLLADRLLKRNETFKLGSHERSDDHVIVHVMRGALVGDDGYLVFEIENRSKSAYRLANVRVQLGDREVNGPARLTTPSTDRDPSVLGVIPAGATGRGIVVIRSVDQVLGKSLAVTVSGPGGAKAIRLDRGIVVK